MQSHLMIQFDFSLFSLYILPVSSHKRKRKMRKKALFSLFSLFICVLFLWPQGTRKPIAAGSYYYGDADRLSRQIDFFLQNVKRDSFPSGKILALIAPHAGYVYSGQVAAHAYRLVQGKDYQTVVIIGPSHRHGFNGCSIYLKGAYESPLGTVEVNEALAAELSEATGFEYVPQAHQQEHCLEVQIPFIQKVLPRAKIVPIVMGIQSRKTITSLAKALSEILPGKKALVIASTDLSHYFPKQKANETDSSTLSLIQSFETDSLINKLGMGENIMCGGGPVVSALLYAQSCGEPGVEVLRYADSSDAGGPSSKVVGYLAAALYLKGPESTFSLSTEVKKELLQLAGSAINHFIKEKKVVDYRAQSTDLLTRKGAFVTLKKKGSLRGCIGFIEPVFPLYETVIRAAIYAACQDQRFPPVTADELKDLEIEISVLTVPERIRDPLLIEVGKHGLIISKGDRKGILLPQVPVENNWSREEFLERACLKAGLPRDAWTSGAEIYIFEAIIFH
jgi:AmmeMemoRadiSam system protein B/AmmeMemoRadiSam system protein A